jgi:NADPH-dependent ferric siderophore reductase
MMKPTEPASAQRSRVFFSPTRASPGKRWDIIMTKQPDDPRELARSVTKEVFEVLLDVLTHPEASPARRRAG